MANICICVHSLARGGGVQELTGLLAQGLVSQGHRVTILCPVKPVKIVPSLPSSVEVIYLGDWADRVRYHLVFLPSKLRAYFKSNFFDAIISNTPQIIAITAYALRASRNSSRLYGVVHGSLAYIGGIKQCVVSLICRYYLNFSKNRVEAYAAVSKGVAREIEKVVGGEVFVLYNPVINDLEVDRVSKKKSRSRKTIISVGRLHRQKGFDLLIKSLECLSDLDFNVKIVGDGPSRKSLEQKVVDCGLDGRVEFLGYRSDVLELMEDSDLYVLSSRWEGFGNVLVEALYCQLPVVSFDCPHGPSEVLEAGRWGALVPVGDTEALANEIRKGLVRGGRNVNKRWKDFCVSSVTKKYVSFLKV